MDFFAENGLLVQSASFGAEHSVAVVLDQKSGKQLVFSWGNSSEGQCGREGKQIFSEPVEIEELASEEVRHVAAGSQHTLFATAKEELWHFYFLHIQLRPCLLSC